MEKIIILHNSYSKTHTKIQISVNRGIEKIKTRMIDWGRKYLSFSTGYSIDFTNIFRERVYKIEI